MKHIPKWLLLALPGGLLLYLVFYILDNKRRNSTVEYVAGLRDSPLVWTWSGLQPASLAGSSQYGIS